MGVLGIKERSNWEPNKFTQSPKLQLLYDFLLVILLYSINTGIPPPLVEVANCVGIVDTRQERKRVNLMDLLFNVISV